MNTPKISFLCRCLPACLLGIAASSALAGDRDIQFKSIDLANGVVELHNFGAAGVSVDGWKLCSHDFNESRKYSGPFPSLSLAPGESLFIYYNNDAPMGNPNVIDTSTLGGRYALPLNAQAYGLGLFAPGADGFVSFNSITDMNDNVQWAIDPSAVGSASTRSAQAVSAGLWTVATEFVVVAADTVQINLTDMSGAELHGPGNYALDPAPCDVDLNNDGFVDSGDITAFVALFLAGDLAADLNNDGFIDSGDIGDFVTLFLAGC